MHNPNPIIPLELESAILNAAADDQAVYLVGGAVRDFLLGIPAHDYDFVLSGEPRSPARRVAHRLNAAFYTLDDERKTYRVMLPNPNGAPISVDITGFRGPDLDADLRARDFTVNAIAVDLRLPARLIDPLGGAADLRARLLRACAPDSIFADPLRLVRAIRLAAGLNLHIVPETRQAMREGVALLKRISPERKRDELFRILDGAKPASALRALDLFDGLPELLPELAALKGVSQTPPHTLDVWNHTLAVLENLRTLLVVLGSEEDPNAHANLFIGMASLRLGRFRAMIRAHYRDVLNSTRTLEGLMYLAALYHDVAKPATSSTGEDGRIHNYGHEDQGAEIVYRRAQAMQLSNAESERLRTVVQHHMRIHHLVRTGKPISRRAIYRYFRDTGSAGVDICLLTLADALGTYGATLPAERWQAYLDVCRTLLENWWERPAESVHPEPILDGYVLQQEFGLAPGPEIGRMLEAVREAQAEGMIETREQALAYARSILGNL